MNSSMLTQALRRIARVIAECNYAQRRMTALNMTPERYLAGRGEAADNYAEFLFRTSGPLLHEPDAGRRTHGQLTG